MSERIKSETGPKILSFADIAILYNKAFDKFCVPLSVRKKSDTFINEEFIKELSDMKEYFSLSEICSLILPKNNSWADEEIIGILYIYSLDKAAYQNVRKYIFDIYDYNVIIHNLNTINEGYIRCPALMSGTNLFNYSYKPTLAQLRDDLKRRVNDLATLLRNHYDMEEDKRKLKNPYNMPLEIEINMLYSKYFPEKGELSIIHEKLEALKGHSIKLKEKVDFTAKLMIELEHKLKFNSCSMIDYDYKNNSELLTYYTEENKRYRTQLDELTRIICLSSQAKVIE